MERTVTPDTDRVEKSEKRTDYAGAVVRRIP